MLIPWIFMMIAVGYNGKKDFDACKLEEFKPKVCQKWLKQKELQHEEQQ